MGEWVRYKLDRQVDHVLVDEAQDTNAAQWDIIDRLVDEFFSGSSEADQRVRTLFMVGDFKQAIYGFQGTDPARFNEAREQFKARAAALDPGGDDLFSYQARTQTFRDLSIAASFRSAQPMLDVVDAVIDAVGPAAIGLTDPPPPHRAHIRPTGPGRAVAAIRDREHRRMTATKAKSAGSRCATEIRRGARRAHRADG